MATLPPFTNTSPEQHCSRNDPVRVKRPVDGPRSIILADAAFAAIQIDFPSWQTTEVECLGIGGHASTFAPHWVLKSCDEPEVYFLLLRTFMSGVINACSETLEDGSRAWTY